MPRRFAPSSAPTLSVSPSTCARTARGALVQPHGRGGLGIAALRPVRAVESVLGDVGPDRIGNEVADRAALRQPPSERGGADPEGRRFQALDRGDETGNPAIET